MLYRCTVLSARSVGGLLQVVTDTSVAKDPATVDEQTEKQAAENQVSSTRLYD